MHTLSRDSLSYFVGPNVQPAISINSGDEVLFETADCFSSNIQTSEQCFTST